MILQVVLPVAFWELLWNDPLKKCLWGFQTQGNQLQAKRDHVGNLWSLEWIDKDTVDGRNPAHPVDIMVNIPLFTELHTCQVVSRISFINSTLKKNKVNQHFLDSSTLSKQGNKQTNKQTNNCLDHFCVMKLMKLMMFPGLSTWSTCLSFQPRTLVKGSGPVPRPNPSHKSLPRESPVQQPTILLSSQPTRWGDSIHLLFQTWELQGLLIPPRNTEEKTMQGERIHPIRSIYIAGTSISYPIQHLTPKKLCFPGISPVMSLFKKTRS